MKKDFEEFISAIASMSVQEGNNEEATQFANDYDVPACTSYWIKGILASKSNSATEIKEALINLKDAAIAVHRYAHANACLPTWERDKAFNEVDKAIKAFATKYELDYETVKTLAIVVDEYSNLGLSY